MRLRRTAGEQLRGSTAETECGGERSLGEATWPGRRCAVAEVWAEQLRPESAARSGRSSREARWWRS
ncbi:UNVERIFIED_CONTAM: hypothetical protein Sradi_2975300 [Sesamum radiatum]|uniref:Uncharacterized protein n=1 Tax=Sesamum radiatum TaxID=300843 RepID=A0AAW2RZY7_SESRA